MYKLTLTTVIGATTSLIRQIEAFQTSKIMNRVGKTKHTNSPTPRPAERPTSLPRYLGLGVCLVLAAGSAWAFAEFVLWNTLPSELVGKWVVEGGEQDGATFDFYRNGRMLGRINMNGREGIVDARVEVAGNKLLATTRNPRTGRDETRSQTIKTLTRKSLELVDERGNVLQMVRANN